jgi:hypothetical protein
MRKSSTTTTRGARQPRPFTWSVTKRSRPAASVESNVLGCSSCGGCKIEKRSAPAARQAEK